MSRLRELVREDVLYRVLCLLADNPNLSQREIAGIVGISAGGVHYLLNALVGAGLIRLSNPGAVKGKRCYAYVLTSDGLAEKAQVARRFLERKVEEFEALGSEIEALRNELDGDNV